MTDECENTDRELWRETPGDFYADSVHVTKEGSLGINCGGHVIVMPLRKWHAAIFSADRWKPVAWIGQYEWSVLTEKKHGAMVYPDQTQPEPFSRPLYTPPVAAAPSTPQPAPVGTFACPVCGVGKPHGHSAVELVLWLRREVGRFQPEWEKIIVIDRVGDPILTDTQRAEKHRRDYEDDIDRRDAARTFEDMIARGEITPEEARRRMGATQAPDTVQVPRDWANLARQWFDNVQDLNPQYLIRDDYKVAAALYSAVGMRVPDSIKTMLAPKESKE